MPALYEALEKTEVNDFSPAWRQVLNDLNCGDIVGANLAIQVRGIFERNQITQQIALAEINELNSRIANLTSSINQIMASMKTMKWHEHLEQVAECEIGFMIPRAVINNDIDMLSKELHEMKFIFNTFSEFVTGETTKFDLVTLSTSDPLVTVSTILKIGSAFGKAVSWLIDSYKKLIEIRKSLEELKSKGVPEENLRGISDHSNGVMKTAIDELIIKLTEEFKASTLKNERENELKVSIELSLNKIANRIDKGFNFEVRVIERQDPNPDSEEAQGRRKTITKIREQARTMEFIKSPGVNLLTLPEDTSKKR